MKKRIVMQMGKRAFIISLAVIMLFSCVNLSAFATPDGEETQQTDNQQVIPDAEENIQGEEENNPESNFGLSESDSTLGRALMSEVPVEVEAIDTGLSSSIREIIVNDNQAKVCYYAPANIEHTVIVGIYDETGKKQLAVGSSVTPEGQDEITVTLSDSVPEYFVVKGFLIETDTLRPLCDSYESDGYTQTMQEFYNTTVESFDASQVVNLDEDDTNNFMVFAEGTKVIRQSEDGTVNQLLESDETNHIYTISNPDESTMALQVGDIFVYSGNNNNIVISKITEIISNPTAAVEQNEALHESVTVSENNVTVSENNLSMDSLPMAEVLPNKYGRVFCL